ncbi:MAG: mechanosensitive ion channel family protein [Pseudomonadota bacterium]|nr:mechanosensitive ion channel family protein [Pseudomonadota bacterium]
MFADLNALWLEWIDTHAWLEPAFYLLLLIFLSWFSNWIAKKVIVRSIQKVLKVSDWVLGLQVYQSKLIPRLSNVVPALILAIGVAQIDGLPTALVNLVQNVANAFIVLTLALAVGAVLDLVNDIYQTREGKVDRPIKSYIQLVKIIVYAITVLLMIASLLDRSPLILLSGLGAIAAVLILVFQDTLLSLVASVQIRSNDLLRVGDWVEMPNLNADGDVIDIALHTVRVQNFDKTITTIPTKRFVTDAFRNWRGMRECGGRRIKRAIYLDQNSVRFLTAEEQQAFHRFALIRDYLHTKKAEIETWNREFLQEDAQASTVNSRRMTNLGVFRAYVLRYLQSSPRLRQDLTLIARQLEPSPQGLPFEVYCFTDTTIWVDYEAIQSDLFDHLLAILPEFGLQVFQQPSGRDWQQLGGR